MSRGRTGVGWDDDPVVREWAGLPALAGDLTADVCVVGLGASGLAAVEALTERGLSGAGVDAGRVGAGAAGRNGGFLLAGPSDPLHVAIGAWGEDAAVALYRETLAELDREAERLGPELVRRTGSLRIAGVPGTPDGAAETADRDRELADCQEQAAALRAHGFAVEPYSGPLGEGLFFPADAATQPARRVIGLAAGLPRSAALFEQTRAVSIGTGRVVTPVGTISCGGVLVAVDGRLETLLPQLDGLVRTARLQMLATAPVVPVLHCPVYARWGYDYAQQDASGRLFVGGGRDRWADLEWTEDADPTPEVQGYLDELAARLAGPVQVTHRWAASVGFTDDGRPVCLPVEDDVVAVGGYSGTGNLVGPVAARAAVAWLLDGTPPPGYLTHGPV